MRARQCGQAAALLLTLAVGLPATARAVQPREARQDLSMACRASLWQFVPPGVEVPDPDAFCACYAQGAVELNIPALEQAQIHPGESVLPPQATEARRLRAEASDKVSSACLGKP